MKNRRIFVIAEAGINHNGDVNIAKKLIDLAVDAGCDAIKFQKRKIEDVYSPAELDRFRESPWGTTNREQKLGLEFEERELDEIDSYCRDKNIKWFVSCWDPTSQKFMRKYNLEYNKVASPMLTVHPLLEEIASEKKYTFISTGMSTLEEIKAAVDIFRKHDCPFELMHCNSTYPMPNESANLRMINILRQTFDCNVGYSGHEAGLQVSLFAAAMGATSIERHITLDRAMYGSDQAASLAPEGITRLVRDIRIFEQCLGDGMKRVEDSELPARNKLASPYWFVK